MSEAVNSETSLAGQEPKQPDGTPQPMTPAEIAWVCHEANRAYCETQGDYSQKPWEEAPQWQRASAVAGVIHAIETPDGDPEGQHKAWLKDKEEAGWTYGPVKDEVRKTHPCIKPFSELPAALKRKDALFRAIVKGLTDR